MRPQVRVMLLLGSLCAAFASGPQVPSQDVTRYLPDGARLARTPVWTHLAPGTPDQVVVFYTYPEKQPHVTTSAVAVLQVEGPKLRKLWSVDCGGAYEQFYPDSGVYDINRTGQLKIVVDCAGTTVCPNFFGLFEYKDGTIRPVAADFTPLRTCRVELRDLNHDGVPEIIDYAEPHNDVPEIYRWTGARYARADSEFPKFWAEHAARYAGKFSRCEHCPLYGLVDMCSDAVTMYRLARTPLKARTACLEARKRIVTGDRVWEASWPSYPKLRSEAVAKIDALVSKIKAPNR